MRCRVYLGTVHVADAQHCPDSAQLGQRVLRPVVRQEPRLWATCVCLVGRTMPYTLPTGRACTLSRRASRWTGGLVRRRLFHT